MFILLLVICVLLDNGYSIDIIERDFNSSIEKILRINENLFIGTENFLHRLSLTTLENNFHSFNLYSSSNESYHIKILLSINNENLFICGTVKSGLCRIIDQNFNIIINSSLPIVANDQINSTIALIIPEENLIYLGVTYTNEGIFRWQIPNISGRSLNLTNFLKIYSIKNDDDDISRDDLSLRFMPRQQMTFIVQYIYSFSTENFIYFLTNQPNDFDETIINTKIIRFCRNKSYSIIRSYSELPLICFNSQWILQSAQVVKNPNEELILIGIFRKRDGSNGTIMCSWQIREQIEKSFFENYRRCYSLGIGQRGLVFIKPNESCRKDLNWSVEMKDDLCSSIVSERLPYPVGGKNSIIGRVFYENFMENTHAFHLHSYGSINLISQGLTNGTLKLGIFHFSFDLHWIYSYQLSTNTSILSLDVFDNQTASFFIASGSKIFRLSFADDCRSRSSCDECLSSSNNVFCGWCSSIERCTLINHCPTNFWKQENNQCTQLIDVQPKYGSIDRIQWINITLSSLSLLEHNEIYQCIFNNEFISINTQAIKLDSNRVSCPTPLNKFPSTKLRLSLIKFPSNRTLATLHEFTFYNCSLYHSCTSCHSIGICQWCFNRCSSICIEKSSNECPSFDLVNSSNIFIESDQSIDIPLNLSYSTGSALECRLNETIIGFIDQLNHCRFPQMNQLNNESMNLTVYQNQILIGTPKTLHFYRCNLFDSCEICQLHSTCSWCDGKCLSNTKNSCSKNLRCTSWKIEEFFPKILPINGGTIVKIFFNEFISEKIIEVTLSDLPCLILKLGNPIECQSIQSNSSRQGLIKISLENSFILHSKQYIEYRRSSIISFNPTIAYEFGGQLIEIYGKDLIIGNSHEIFIGNIPCPLINQSLICRLPSISSGFYNLTVRIDQKTIITNGILFRITPNPIVEDIYPLTSFASGGRLVHIRGMYFRSAQSIFVRFSYEKWNTKLKIHSNDILSSDNGMISSFQFRTPPITIPLTQYISLPIDINFSIEFDHLFILPNLIQFHYISDILLNISSVPPTLPYTGEELKIQIENLTEGASIEDIQLLVGCDECQLKNLTSKGIICQPPSQLLFNSIDCPMSNSSIGSIRFRIGFREYLIGYLSYISSSSRYSFRTILLLSLSSCLFTIILLLLALGFYFKMRKSKEKTSSLSNIEPNNENDKIFWSTTTMTTSAVGNGPYYQVYEQIPSLCSHQNTLRQSSVVVCPHHHHHYRENCLTLLSKRHLRHISIEDQQLKKLLFISDIRSYPSNIRQSMELFYDLLLMNPFHQAFLQQLIQLNNENLYEYSSYIFRYDPSYFTAIPSTRQLSFYKLISTFLLQSKRNLIETFYSFDKLISELIDFLDSSPCDQLLNRSMKSFSSTTLLLLSKFDYHSIQLPINYENLFHFHLSVFNCDTIDQITNKIIHHFNSIEDLSHADVDICLPLKNSALCSHQIPMIKDYSIDSIILCRKTKRKEKKNYLYHLAMENQLIHDQKLIEQRLKENKNLFQNVLNNFYEEILNGFTSFHLWKEQMKVFDQNHLFQLYIQMISDLLRKIHLLMITRSNCPIIQSCLNVIADGLESIFQTKNSIKSEIKMLFEEERSSFHSHGFQIPSNSMINSLSLSSCHIRSLILEDDLAIECLFELYRFYELYSEPINQHIGENHVSVLLPVHHLLMQIRQLINSDTIPTII